MNGFKLLSDSYKKALSLGEISREEAEKKCRVFDFLATCDKDDFYNQVSLMLSSDQDVSKKASELMTLDWAAADRPVAQKLYDELVK